ncbi:ABC-three component system protein [Xanthomonas arboricola]|uniref:ABC-three component system protein n=1 Tax=Xanthomonas arboricola TaxID=56448 RepID=UPI0032E91C87
MSVKQIGNTASGNIVAGNYTVNINQQLVNEIHALYGRLKASSDGQEPAWNGFCEQLEHYLSSTASSDVRGLEEKLKSSDRLDQLDNALFMKERATKAIMRLQSSKTAQRIYTIILDELHTKFMLSVTPLVQAGASRIEVDREIQAIVFSINEALGENPLEISSKDVLGFLYFLGGNCHVRWDKC